jgi:large subunit ribosomal protein L30
MVKDLENKLLAVIRVRGRVGVRHTISETLSRLNLRKVNNMVLLYGTKSNLGMIAKCNDYVTYGEVDSDFVEKMLAMKGAKVSKDDISALAAGKKSAKQIVETPMRLHPPTHGYENTRKPFSQKGSLGYRGTEISKLISRMA